MTGEIPVVVGLLCRADGTILVCQRSAGKPYPLEWEFPGGKVEPGEEPEGALRRELREELGIDCDVGRQLHVERADYSDGRTYHVAYYQIEVWRGEIVNREFHDVQWVQASDLDRLAMLQGSRHVVELIVSVGVDGLPVR